MKIFWKCAWPRNTHRFTSKQIDHGESHPTQMHNHTLRLYILICTSRLELCRQAIRSAEIHLEARKQQDTSDGKMHTHTAAQRYTKTHKHWLEKHTVSHWLICPTFPRLLADLGWGSFFSCISLYHTLTAAVNSTWQSKPPSLSSHTHTIPRNLSLTPSHPHQKIQRLNPQASMPAVLNAAVPHSPLYT